MKFLCPSCERIADIASFRVQSGALALTCAKCGVEAVDASPKDLTGATSEAPAGARGIASPMSAPLASAPHAPSVASASASQQGHAGSSSSFVSSAPSAAATPARLLPSPAGPSGQVATHPSDGGARPTASRSEPKSSAALSRNEEGPTPGAPAPEGSVRDAAGRVVFLRAVSQGSALPASRLDPLAVPDGFCPKCVSPRRGTSTACASCGLVFSVFNPLDHQPAAPIMEAWQALSRAWDDNNAHERFLQLAAVQGGLATAGRLYRIQLAHSPDDPYAARGRDEVFRMAAAASPLSVHAEERRFRVGSKRLQYVALAVVGFLFLLVMAYAIRSLRALGAP